MTSACFTISKEGIRLEHKTTQEILLCLALPAENFEEYIFDEPEPIHIGLGANVNKEFFKYVKNKDIIVMSITKPFIFDLERKTDNKLDVCQCKLSLSIETTQNITPFVPETYVTNPVEISAVSFNQLCRSFESPVLTVVKAKGQLSISNDTGISTRTLIFGEEMNEAEMNYQTFYTDQFNRINKLSSFVGARLIKIYSEKDKPMYLKCASDIGVMNVYVYPITV